MIMNTHNSLFTHIYTPIQANPHVIEKHLLDHVQRCAPVEKKGPSKETHKKRYKDPKKKIPPLFRSYSPLLVDMIVE